MDQNLKAKVAIEKTAYSFDKAYDYAVPDSLTEKAARGVRVVVPFGRGDGRRQGIILAVESGDCSSLKEIISLLDEKPVLSDELLKIAAFMKEHYFCTFYEAVKTMLPLGINYRLSAVYGAQKDDNFSYEELSDEEKRIYDFLFSKRKAQKLDRLLDTFGYDSADIFDNMVKKGALYRSDGAFRRIGDAKMKMAAPVVGADDPSIKLTPKQKDVYELICAAGGVSVKEVCYFTGVSSAVIKALADKGLIRFYDEEIFRIENRRRDPEASEIILSDEQRRACDSLYKEYADPKPRASLLFGVTGSGKTCVFIKLIERVIADGGDVIVMVPEISLTPQFVTRFSRRFGEIVAVFHSALSAGERLDEYKRAASGDAKIVIGTRSAVFAPLNNLRLIIMDEEQEYSYKSENSPRYHARDIAKLRCACSNALLVLSSATPSVETYTYALSGVYSLNTLTERYGEAVLPEVVVADMNDEIKNGNVSGFSEILLQNIRYNLERGKQSILLLNRRGYNTYVLCKDCGKPVSCPHCSISLTYHSANNRLMCHYCGYSVPRVGVCPSCKSHNLRYSGSGTQRAEDDISEIFPEARILRMDADSASARSSYEKMITAFSNGEYDILVGTQMVAKGLDFPNVTLVGVLNTDRMLYADDYRSYERTFSLLTQVAGRCGRGASKGLAVIQTFTPNNPIISMAASQDYTAFYNTEIQIRKALRYPPYSNICLIGFVGSVQKTSFDAAKEFLKLLAETAESAYSDIPLQILGPSPALVVKVNNKYRYKLIIKCRNDSRFRSLLSRAIEEFGRMNKFRGVGLYADMNALVC